MERSKRIQSKSKPGIKVQVHSPPKQPVPLILPTSPDMIPRFAPQERVAPRRDAQMTRKPLKRTELQNKIQTKQTFPSSRGKFITKQEVKRGPTIFQNQQTRSQNLSIPLNIGKQRIQKSRKSSTLTNLGNEVEKPERKAFTSRESTDKTDDKDLLKEFLTNEFPPYNPDEFTPKEDSVSEEQGLSENELLQNIRRELNEWLSKCPEPEKKKTCPEQWTTVPSTYRTEDEIVEDSSKRHPPHPHPRPSRGSPRRAAVTPSRPRPASPPERDRGVTGGRTRP